MSHHVLVLTAVLRQAHLVVALHDIGSVPDIMLSVYLVSSVSVRQFCAICCRTVVP
jgi:hypothetical protein